MMEPIPPIPDEVFDEKQAQLSLHRRHKPTNPLATAFGERGYRRYEEMVEKFEGGKIEISQAMDELE